MLTEAQLADARAKALEGERLSPEELEQFQRRKLRAPLRHAVTSDGYQPLTLQFLFRGEEYNKTDPWFKSAMVLDLKPQDGKFVGTVRIVLARA
jgi:hypothetical protein